MWSDFAHDGSEVGGVFAFPLGGGACKGFLGDGKRGGGGCENALFVDATILSQSSALSWRCECVRDLLVSFIHVTLVLRHNAVGDLFRNPAPSGTCAVHQEAGLVQRDIGDVQSCVNSSEDNAACALDVVVETGNVVAVAV